jgi:hypothetical protein
MTGQLEWGSLSVWTLSCSEQNILLLKLVLLLSSGAFFQLPKHNKQYQNINIKNPAHPLCNNRIVRYAVSDLMYEKNRVKAIKNVSLY